MKENVQEMKNKYYIRINENDRVVKVFSDVFEKAEESDILIGEGNGSQFRANKEILGEELQGVAGIENGLGLINEQGLYCLKFDNGKIEKVSDEELTVETRALPKPEPTRLEVLEIEYNKLKEDYVSLEKRVVELEGKMSV